MSFNHEETGSNEHLIRLEKLKAMEAVGINPWPEMKEVPNRCAQVIHEFKEDDAVRTYTIAGRIMTYREHGQTAFATIQDSTGKLQIYLRKDILGEEAFKNIQHFFDVGDIVFVQGSSFKTKTGEITIKATTFEMLSKSLHPLPEKFHGLTNIETIYRQRYLDLICNPESKERFVIRSGIVRAMRIFFDKHGFLEVETPMLHPIPGGAAARPFITHHNALSTDFYLRIAPELYLKRLVVGGLERVYEINRNFRNEGISTRHNPEFTMVEFYMAHANYTQAMDLVEELLRSIATAIGKVQAPFGTHTIDFANPFTRISMADAVKKYGNLTDADLSEHTIFDTIKSKKIHLKNKNASWGEALAALFEELVEPELIQPTFITHFPISISPLAKRDPKNPAIAARFELFIGGMELSNGFNELNDPLDQAQRFRDQAAAHTAGDHEAHHYDADYVLALEHALPPTAGVGIGIDRLTMLLTNTTSIKDVILFPTLKKQ